MSEIEPQNPLEQRGVAVLPLEKIQYFNGFEMGITHTDIILTLKINDYRMTTYHMSFTTAKTFARNLQKTVEILEKATNQTLMTIDDLKKAVPKISELIQKEKIAKAKPAKKSK